MERLENIIEIRGLKKHFKVLNRKTGLLGVIRDLFSRDYKLVKAVDGIDLSIKQGEIVGFLGPNGAGKSTTIKMMTGVLEPSEGELLINGQSPFKSRIKFVRNIGVVLGQRTQLWWEIPVIESFRLLKEMFQISDSDYNENLELFNELGNIKELFNVPVRNLSLGQRMLCDIAASFLHNPAIIFLDEPTIGLDVAIKSKIRALIKRLNREKNTTIILTTHDISDVEALCERIVLIDKGSLIYNGAIEDFNKIFGSYRTLKLHLEPTSAEELESSLSKIKSLHETIEPVIKADDPANAWINITIDQDKIPLSNLINSSMSSLPVKDLKIEEISTEKVIQQVYEGALK